MLDALRAAAMLLGVFWHAALFARFIEGSVRLPGHDRISVAAMDTFIVGMHAFRMPLFFLLAGFFAALVAERSGGRRFARVRLTRIGLPLLVAYVTVIPLTRYAMEIAQGGAVDASVLVPGRLGAVWFLWYLLLFYAGALLLRRVIGARQGVDAAFRGLLASRWRLPLLVALTALLLARVPHASPPTPAAWTPDGWAYLLYGLFFGFGWLMWARRDALAQLQRNALAHTVLAAIATVALTLLERRGGAPILATAGLGAVVAWSSTFAAFGLGARLFAQNRPAVRYLADSAYWLYLGHGPLVIAFDALLLAAGVPLLLAVLLSGVLACGVLLVAYELGVRYTAVGAVLHGRRTREHPPAWAGGRVPAVQPGPFRVPPS